MKSSQETTQKLIHKLGTVVGKDTRIDRHALLIGISRRSENT